MVRLVSADAVKEIICKHESRLKQRQMIYEIEMLPGLTLTTEQIKELKERERETLL